MALQHQVMNEDEGVKVWWGLRQTTVLIRLWHHFVGVSLQYHQFNKISWVSLRVTTLYLSQIESHNVHQSSIIWSKASTNSFPLMNFFLMIIKLFRMFATLPSNVHLKVSTLQRYLCLGQSTYLTLDLQEHYNAKTTSVTLCWCLIHTSQFV